MQHAVILQVLLAVSAILHADCRTNYGEAQLGERCTDIDQCAGLHRNCSEQQECVCADDYRPTLDLHSALEHLCRPNNTGVGVLGDRCMLVSDCNWHIAHVECRDERCACGYGTSGFRGGNQCYTESSWRVGFTVITSLFAVLAVVFALILMYRYVTRSRVSKPITWLHRGGSHVSLQWSGRNSWRTSLRRSIRRSLRRSAAPARTADKRSADLHQQSKPTASSTTGHEDTVMGDQPPNYSQFMTGSAVQPSTMRSGAPMGPSTGGTDRTPHNAPQRTPADDRALATVV